MNVPIRYETTLQHFPEDRLEIKRLEGKGWEITFIEANSQNNGYAVVLRRPLLQHTHLVSTAASYKERENLAEDGYQFVGMVPGYPYNSPVCVMVRYEPIED